MPQLNRCLCFCCSELLLFLWDMLHSIRKKTLKILIACFNKLVFYYYQKYLTVNCSHAHFQGQMIHMNYTRFINKTFLISNSYLPILSNESVAKALTEEGVKRYSLLIGKLRKVSQLIECSTYAVLWGNVRSFLLPYSLVCLIYNRLSRQCQSLAANYFVSKILFCQHCQCKNGCQKVCF